jgi:hypothetical protein
LKEWLEDLLLCPPVPVRFQGSPIGVYTASTGVVEPGRHTVSLTPAIQRHISQFLPVSLEDPLRVEIDIIDLDLGLMPGDLAGRIVFVRVRESNELKALLEKYGQLLRIDGTASLDGADGKLELRSNVSVNKELIDELRAEWNDIPEGMTQEERAWIEGLLAIVPEQATRSFSSFRGTGSVEMFSSFPPKQSLYRLSDLLGLSLNPRINSDHWFVVAHAGVVLPSAVNGNFEPFLRSAFAAGHDTHFGAVRLSGRIRLGLSLNREQIRDVPWEFCLLLEYAIRRYYGDLGEEADLSSNDIIGGAEHCEFPSMARLDVVGVILNWSRWDSLSIFDRDTGRSSLEELCGEIARGQRVTLALGPISWEREKGRSDARLINVVRAHLLANTFEVNLESPGSNRGVLVRRITAPVMAGERLFPPLTFVHMGDADAFTDASGFVNRDHPFAAWLIETAPMLMELHAPIFARVKTALLGEMPTHIAHKELTSCLETLDIRARSLAPLRESWPRADQFGIKR